MAAEIIQVDDLENIQERAPFLIYIPGKLEIKNVTYRSQGRKWATLRYECKIGYEKLRVKEFFLDWFYPGFPKSLMDSFVSSYSAIDGSILNDRAVFYGKNYKGKKASSSFSFGTQIEVEGDTEKNVKKLSETMIAPYLNERFRNYPFFRRSFFANRGVPEWFEEERISNLAWKEPPEEFCVGNLCVDSVGVSHNDGRRVETILVFSEEYYRTAAWVDIAEPDSHLQHLIYDLRKDGNFFDVYEDGDPTVAFKRDSGPTIARTKIGSSVVTISISPLFQLSEARKMIQQFLETVEKFI